MLLTARIAGHSTIDFDKRTVRKAMRAIGIDVRRTARRMVSRRAVSKPGEYPGRDTGALMRSIRYRVSNPGFLVRIAPMTIEGANSFYPAILAYGVRSGATRRNNHRAQSYVRKRRPDVVITGTDWRLEPRANYMADALAQREAHIQSVLRTALYGALNPR